MSPSLFHKKSKNSLSGGGGGGSSSSSQKAQAEIRSLHAHARKLSTASTASGSSSASHRKPGSIDPLACHPPLALNTSPHFNAGRYHEDEEREAHFFNQTRRAEDHLQDSPEDSPVKGENCFFRRDGRGPMAYVYDQEAQWPLKDWQTIPPGLAPAADIDDDDTSQATPTPPRARPTNHQRRPTEWMDDPKVLIKRGGWKRRGIVFGLDEAAEEEQEQHFELPGRSSAYFPFGAQ